MPAPTFSRRFDSKPTLPNYTFPKAVVNRIPFFLTNYPTPVTRRFCGGNIRSSRRLKPGSKRVRSKARDLTRLLTSSTTAPRNTVHREKLKASNPEVSTTSPRSRPMRGKRGKRRQEEYPPLYPRSPIRKPAPRFWTPFDAASIISGKGRATSSANVVGRAPETSQTEEV